jgi:EAL domain-containing protein (putative c-di-GMP-specific phosphodiesterase class I)
MPRRACRRLTALRELGCRVALEEFSSVSLRTIERLPIGMLKMGRQVVQHCAKDASAMRLLNAAVAVSRAFGVPLGAVGVQTHARRTGAAYGGLRHGPRVAVRPGPVGRGNRRHADPEVGSSQAGGQ